jgi:hypothetical protein
MTTEIKTCCQWRVTGGQPWNPTSAKTGQIWGTRHSLRNRRLYSLRALRPGVSWIPAHQFAPHLRIEPLPEARKVGCRLYRSLIRSQ